MQRNLFPFMQSFKSCLTKSCLTTSRPSSIVCFLRSTVFNSILGRSVLLVGLKSELLWKYIDLIWIGRRLSLFKMKTCLEKRFHIEKSLILYLVSELTEIAVNSNRIFWILWFNVLALLGPICFEYWFGLNTTNWPDFLFEARIA